MLEAVYFINTIILSMYTKQHLFDQLESEMFHAPNIYADYIDALIYTNLKLLGIKETDRAAGEYKQLLERYISNEISDPDEIIDILIDNRVRYLPPCDRDCNKDCNICFFKIKRNKH